jgi:ribosomal protein S18 acetylase RimI-like enzyme
MELRDATAADVSAIRGVARESLLASYGHAVDEALLTEAVDEWYDTAELTAEIEDERTVYPVAVVDGDVVGFAESYVVGRRERVGEIDWLHVHPDHRESGIGSALLERAEAELQDVDVDRIEARVLVANEAGTAFYEGEGYELVGERTVDIGEETFDER